MHRPGGTGPSWLHPRIALLGRERARPESVRVHAHAWWFAVATVCFGAFMGQLDASIVTLTYAPLSAEFDASLAGVEWVSLAYLLALVALLVPVGRLADTHGRKLLYLYGFVVFTAASAACGLAPTLGALVGFRILQGLGAAMLQANSVALVTTSAPRNRLRAALGVQAAAQALGLALGPTVGGVLVATVGWRWVFGINVPVGVAAIVAGHYLLPRTRERAPAAPFDWPGLLLLASATTSALLAVSAASGLPAPTWTVGVLGASALLAVGALAWRERRAEHPLIDPRLLRSRAVAGGLVGALGGYLVLFGPLVAVPVTLAARGVGALHAGLVVTALPAGFAAGALAADRVLPGSWSDRARGAAGLSLCVAALGTAAAVPSAPGLLAVLLGLIGLGLGTFVPANNAAVMASIPHRFAGTGGGLVNMTRGLGTALGVALTTLALHLAPRTGTGPDAGAHAAMATLAAAATAALAATLISPGPDHHRNPGAP